MRARVWASAGLLASAAALGGASAAPPPPESYTVAIRPSEGASYRAVCQDARGTGPVVEWRGDRAEVREIRFQGLRCAITQLTGGGRVSVEVTGPRGGRSIIRTGGAGSTSLISLG